MSSWHELPAVREHAWRMRDCIETARHTLEPGEYRIFIAWLMSLLDGERIPVTERFTRRPVYERYLRRKHHMPLDPPDDAERRDAIRILRDPWEDDVAVEALRILDEAGR